MRWKSIYHPDWQRRFAHLPVMLDDHTEIWLEYYYQRYIPRTKDNGGEFEHERQVGRWERVFTLPDNRTKLRDRNAPSE